MVSTDRLAALSRFYQVILHTEDVNMVLPRLVPTILDQLSGLGLDYQFIMAAFIADEQKISQHVLADAHIPDGAPTTAIDIFNFDVILQKGGIWENELLWGQPIVTGNIEPLIKPTYHYLPHLKSIIISPIHAMQKLVGVLILSSARPVDQVSKEELELVDLVTDCISLNYRLQDTENSLSKITQDVYKANAQLHQLDKLKDDFVSIASHELRTPMTAIRSYTWMALNRPDIPLSMKMKRYLERTLISTERLINLVNDMLNVSRIEAGRIEITPKSFDIVQLCKDVMEEVGEKARENQIKLMVLEIPIPQVFADPDKVHEVLLNLIGNALKFTFPNGSVTASFFTDGKVVEVSIKDTGKGVAKEDLQKLFKKFERLDNSFITTNASGGTGLGLYLSKSLVELMHGKIWATSEGVNLGSTFTFSLPVATPELIAEAEKYTVKAQGGEAKPLEPVAI